MTPHSNTRSTLKASQVRNIAPTLVRLLTLSSTITSGSFSEALNSSGEMRCKSQMVFFFILPAKVAKIYRLGKNSRYKLLRLGNPHYVAAVVVLHIVDIQPGMPQVIGKLIG